MNKETKIEEKLLQIGNEWKKGTMHRIYFSNLPKLYGLNIQRHKTGNIKSATLNEEKISNNKATKLEIALNSGKMWYNVNTGKINSKDLSEKQQEIIISNIKKLIGDKI